MHHVEAELVEGLVDQTSHEAESGVWIPLDYLANPAHRSTLPIRTPLGQLTFPCCRYQGYCIWGLSYSMTQEFLRKR